MEPTKAGSSWLKIEMCLENEAFIENRGGELARILKGLSAKMYTGNTTAGQVYPLYDLYGNRIGHATFKD